MASNCPILFTHPFSPIYIFYSVTISPGYKKNSKNNRSLGRRESYGGGVGFSVTISPGYKKSKSNEKKTFIYGRGGGGGEFLKVGLGRGRWGKNERGGGGRGVDS